MKERFHSMAIVGQDRAGGGADQRAGEISAELPSVKRGTAAPSPI